MDFDDMLEELGEFGKFQITIYVLICLPVLFGASNSISYVFTAGIPNYRCFIPECEDEFSPYDAGAQWLKWAVPPEKTNVNDYFQPSYCERYVVQNFTNYTQCLPNLFSKEIEKCSQWIFDNDERTIVNDWNITCIDNQWKLSLVGSCHFAGIIVGSGLFGFLADRYGRKLVFIFCILLMSTSGIAQTVAPDYVTFDILIFINALGTAGIYPLAFIIGVEMVGKKKREITGFVLNYFYAIGEAVVALIAWWCKDWAILQLVISAPALLFACYYWIIPESVRWLLANERKSKAKYIICKVAKVNKVILSDDAMNTFNEKLTLQDGKDEDETRILPILKEMFKSKKMIIRFSIIYLIWAVNAFVYYGLSVNSTSMSGNKYINFALINLIEIPGYTLAWISIRKYGRRMSLVLSLLLCGLTCTLTIWVPPDMTWAITSLFLCGKLGITSAFGISYVYTAELLPTPIRSGGVGSASTVARVGALVAPFVPLLGVYMKSLPSLAFGIVAISAGILAFKLPETLGNKLPETAEEATLI